MAFVDINNIEKDFNFIEFYLKRMIEHGTEAKKIDNLKAWLTNCNKLKDQDIPKFIRCCEVIDSNYKRLSEELDTISQSVLRANENLEFTKLKCVEENLSESDIRACFKKAKKSHIDNLKHIYLTIK